jgi:hypothetical protein
LKEQREIDAIKTHSLTYHQLSAPVLKRWLNRLGLLQNWHQLDRFSRMWMKFASRCPWQNANVIVTGFHSLTLSPLMWRIWWAPNNASRWQMGFNWAFKGLIVHGVDCHCVSNAFMTNTIRKIVNYRCENYILYIYIYMYIYNVIYSIYYILYKNI